MADLITKSAPGEKSSAYHYIDASREAFSLRVDGDFPGTREFWYAYRELALKGGAFNAEGLEISPGMHGEGYGRAIMGDLIDASRLMGIEKIKLRAEDIGIYVWLKMGFLPTSEAWREMRREAFDFILLHRPLLEKDRDVTALLTQVMAGGPSMARVLNLIDTEVPSRKIPSRFTRKMMPFGKVFFLEAASPWNGVLDLRDADGKGGGKLPRKRVGWLMNTLRSGQVRYPSNRWGAFADNPAFDVGIAEEAWVALARSAWIESGGTEEKFNEAFPRYAYLLAQSTPL